MFEFYEFFAGGGMARAGLGDRWQCLFANDFDHKKGRVYRDNWGEGELKTADVGSLKTADLPGDPSLVWGSFPCQDLSLAGAGAGLKGDRSGTFWPFWRLMKSLIDENRAPPMIVLENVSGTLTSHGGKDFTAICGALHDGGYRFGAMVIDAALFLPHSRPRLFIIAVRQEAGAFPAGLVQEAPHKTWHTATLKRAHAQLPDKLKRGWIWWSLTMPPAQTVSFADLVEENPASVEWNSAEQTRELLAMMSTLNREKVTEAQRISRRLGRQIVGCIYKRTREDESGVKVQRAEVRFDDVAGCLRTPAGGSSRQVILVVGPKTVRSRLISSRETARLMGLPDSYRLPENYNEAYHLTGDGVAVPVVRHLAQHIFEPILSAAVLPEKKAGLRQAGA
jgi:DNA (cytosine-5)-methyltransferase 1